MINKVYFLTDMNGPHLYMKTLFLQTPRQSTSSGRILCVEITFQYILNFFTFMNKYKAT